MAGVGVWAAHVLEKVAAIAYFVVQMLPDEPPQYTRQVQFARRVLPLWQEIISVGADVVKFALGQVLHARQALKEALDAGVQRLRTEAQRLEQPRQGARGGGGSCL